MKTRLYFIGNSCFSAIFSFSANFGGGALLARQQRKSDASNTTKF